MADLPHPPDQIPITRSERQRREVERRRSHRKRYGSLPGDIILIALLAFAAVLLYALIQSKVTGRAPELAGRQLYIAVGDSMSPSFGPGSLLVARKVNPIDLKVGDIIIFVDPANPAQAANHRIQKIDATGGLTFITRGDANLRDDPMPVPKQNILGKYEFAIAHAGYIFKYFQTTTGLILMVLLPALLVIVFELHKLRRYLAEAGKMRSGRPPLP